jgi:hypothetical protein
MLMAIHFLRGTLKEVMKSVKKHLESLENISSCAEKWDEFRKCLVNLHGDSDYCTHFLHSDIRSEHISLTTDPDEPDYVKAAGNGLLIAGSWATLPSLGILAINAVGFTSSGVTAGILLDRCHYFLPC